MADPGPQHQQGVSPSGVTNYYSGPVYSLQITGCAPHTLNFGTSHPKELIGASLLEARPPESAPFPSHKEFAIYLGDEMIFDVPQPNQLLRKLTADNSPLHFYICDRELDETLQSHHPRRAFMIYDLASALQNIFLSRNLSGNQSLLRKLTESQAEVNADLRMIINGFHEKKEKLLADRMEMGPGGLARYYWILVLAFLQSRKITVSLDSSYEPSPNGRRLQLLDYVTHVEPNGILFDLRWPSNESSNRFVRWRGSKSLAKYRMWFNRKDLDGIFLAIEWFGPPPFIGYPDPHMDQPQTIQVIKQFSQMGVTGSETNLSGSGNERGNRSPALEGVDGDGSSFCDVSIVGDIEGDGESGRGEQVAEHHV